MLKQGMLCVRLSLSREDILRKALLMHRQRWQIVTSLIISCLIFLLAIINRSWLLEALSLARTANPLWLIVALGLIVISYLVSSQVFQVVLSSLGYRFGIRHLWAIALVAIMISQSVPAGGVGSYAFLVNVFSRRNVPSGQSTLVASLETLSYATAMLLIFLFSLFHLMVRQLGTIGSGVWFGELLLAGFVAVLVIGGATFILTRNEATLSSWLLAIQHGVSQMLRRSWDETWIQRIVGELVQGRTLVASRPGGVALLVGIQFTALSGHSLAMLTLLYALGVQTTFTVVLTAFGIALITSTFNVLPGGGGTVETALVAVLTALGIGPEAVPAAIIFRLLNFWLLLPVAAACYHWLMHGTSLPKESKLPFTEG